MRSQNSLCKSHGRLLWFPSMGHGEMNFGPVGCASQVSVRHGQVASRLVACKRIVAEMMSLEATLH